MRPIAASLLALATAGLLLPAEASAQTIGTFRWQLVPYCNVLTVTVVQNGGVYALDGFDDQCGAAERAPLVGVATPNPDGTIGLGFSIVTAPAGQPVHVAASITLATVAGSWRDSTGASGTFAFLTGAPLGGGVRPPARPAFQHIAAGGAGGNIIGNLTRIDHPLLNGNPNALVFVEHVFQEPASGVYLPDGVGVYYAAGAWSIFREDVTQNMPVGAKFNVLVVKQ